MWEQLVMAAVGSKHNETSLRVQSLLSAYIPSVYKKEELITCAYTHTHTLENLLDFLELRQVLSTYDGDLRGEQTLDSRFKCCGFRTLLSSFLSSVTLQSNFPISLDSSSLLNRTDLISIPRSSLL